MLAKGAAGTFPLPQSAGPVAGAVGNPRGSTMTRAAGLGNNHRLPTGAYDHDHSRQASPPARAVPGGHGARLRGGSFGTTGAVVGREVFHLIGDLVR
jgi:hypothetical protein